MTAIVEETAVDTGVPQVPQAIARKMLRRLMAERNVRTTGMGQVLGIESHTIRRMLNGSRNITLEEIVVIATLGGYSLDEYFLAGSPRVMSQQPSRAENVEGNLSKVFSAIAELLAGNAAEAASALPDNPIWDKVRKVSARQPSQVSSDPSKRGRGRPRKYTAGNDGLPGPQW
jgi:hypothetical protein